MPERPDLTSLLRIAHPTINLDGRDNTSLAQGLLSLSIIEQTSGLYRCEATFGNWGPRNGAIDFLYFDRQTLDFGKTLKIKIGERRVVRRPHHRAGRPLRRSAPAGDRRAGRRSLPGSAHDAPHAHLRRRERFRCVQPHRRRSRPDAERERERPDPSRCWRRSTRAIWPSCASARAPSTPSCGWTAARSTPSRTPTAAARRSSWGTAANLRAFTVLADLAHQRTSVAVSGWDVAGKAGCSYEADGVGRQRRAQRRHQRRQHPAVGALARAKRRWPIPCRSNSGEAQPLAEAYFKLSARRFVVGRGVAETEPKLRVGAQVDIAERSGRCSAANTI